MQTSLVEEINLSREILLIIMLNLQVLHLVHPEVYLSLVDLEFTILLPLLSKGWDCRCVPRPLATASFSRAEMC